jgi:hypothetical protein
MLFLQFSMTSSLLAKYFPQHCPLEEPRAVFLLNVRDQVSHPYKTGESLVAGLVNLLKICLYLPFSSFLSVSKIY